MRRDIVSNVHIAVVDHEPLTRDFIANVMMYSVNREIYVFDDFEGVRDHLKAGRTLHLVISEVHLPGQSGFALLRFLKQHQPQICFVTMSANPADEIPAMSLGADAFLAKPFALKDLFAIVQRFIIENNDARGPAAGAQTAIDEKQRAESQVEIPPFVFGDRPISIGSDRA